jgi:hypothetical protein
MVASHIGLKFGQPKVCARLWYRGETAMMTMPEASMHEYHGLVLRKHEVWMSGQASLVQPESQS